MVAGPGAEPECFAPWAAETTIIQYPAHEGPFRIALANGYIANTWRIQMIPTAKAHAAQPEVTAKLAEFIVVCTGEDVAAQISATNNFIDAAYQGIVVTAQNSIAFGPVIKRANEASVVLVTFDNILGTTDAVSVTVDQKGIGTIHAKWPISEPPDDSWITKVRGVTGTSVATSSHNGLNECLNASGKPNEIIEVVGKWDNGTGQKFTADANAVRGAFDGIAAQGGDTGIVQALKDAGHAMVTFAVGTENGFRKVCAAESGNGLVCSSSGAGPAQVGVAIKTAIALPDCNVDLDASEIMGQTEADQ